MTDTQTAATVALHEEAGIDARLFAALVMRFGPPEQIIAADPVQLAAVPGISAARAAAVAACRTRVEDVRKGLDALAGRGIRTLGFFGPHYPDRLRGIAAPPPCLYVRGALPAGERCVAVTGRADAPAERVADAVTIGKRLAELGVGVVSGLARGIDGGAHLGALAAGGRTYAVLGSGLEAVSPPEHRTLAGQVAASGGLCSEYPPAVRVSRERLRERNRILVGLSQAVIVIAAADPPADAGVAAEAALRQGKPVFVLPGDESPAAAGLLSKGAYPIADLAGLEAVLRLV